MGYTLYITRSPSVPPEDGGIAWQDFVQVLLRDAALRRDSQTPGLTVLYQPGPAEPAARLTFANNALACVNPDEPTVDKLVALAAELSAEVRGEEGERYLSGAAAPEPAEARAGRRHRLRVRFPAPLLPKPVMMKVESATDASASQAVLEDSGEAVAKARPAIEESADSGAPVEASAEALSGSENTAEAPAAPELDATLEAKTPTPGDIKRANKQAGKQSGKTSRQGAKAQKMPVGFPDGQREPSAALRGLLNPLAKPEPKVAVKGLFER